MELRLIPAAALLQARSEAEHLAQGDAQALGLCLNACILARAAFDRDGRAAFQSGADVLALAIAAYNPKRVWLPLLFGLSSYICYTAGLPGDAIFDL